MSMKNLLGKLKEKIDPTSSSDHEKEEDPPAYFQAEDFMPSERKCMEILRKIRWKDGVFCQECKSKSVVKFGKSNKKHAQRYRCNSCGSTFNDLKGTIFEGTKMNLREWVYVNKRLLEGASMNQISKELGREFNSIMRIRDLATNELARKLIVELKGDVELDETYVSAGQKGTKCEKRPPRERGLKLRGRGTYDQDKPPILALVERGGKALLDVARDLSNKFVNKELKDHVEEGSDVYHDNFTIYNFIPNYEDFTIDKKNEGFVNEKIHVNTAEGLFSLLKSWLRTFRGVRKDNLWKPLKIFEFNLNFRELSPFQRLSSFISALIPS